MYNVFEFSNLYGFGNTSGLLVQKQHHVDLLTVRCAVLNGCTDNGLSNSYWSLINRSCVCQFHKKAALLSAVVNV